jgi:putative FmdB family regulatory protein
MPIYEYACQSCGHGLEVQQRMSEPPLRTCPACGKDELEKQISLTSFQLKGGGWYKDGYGSGKSGDNGAEGAKKRTENDRIDRLEKAIKDDQKKEAAKTESTSGDSSSSSSSASSPSSSSSTPSSSTPSSSAAS